MSTPIQRKLSEYIRRWWDGEDETPTIEITRQEAVFILGRMEMLERNQKRDVPAPVLSILRGRSEDWP